MSRPTVLYFITLSLHVTQYQACTNLIVYMAYLYTSIEVIIWSAYTFIIQSKGLYLQAITISDNSSACIRVLNKASVSQLDNVDRLMASCKPIHKSAVSIMTLSTSQLQYETGIKVVIY